MLEHQGEKFRITSRLDIHGRYEVTLEKSQKYFISIGGAGGGGSVSGIYFDSTNGERGEIMEGIVDKIAEDLSVTIYVGKGGANGIANLLTPSCGADGESSSIEWKVGMETLKFEAKGGKGGSWVSIIDPYTRWCAYISDMITMRSTIRSRDASPGEDGVVIFAEKVVDVV